MAQRAGRLRLTPLPALPRLPIWLDGVALYHVVLPVAPDWMHISFKNSGMTWTDWR